MGRYARRRPKRLAEKLLHIRTALGLSQDGMLQRLGLAETRLRTTVSAYERGGEPDLLVLLRYAHLAGVWVDYIIDDELDLPKRLPATIRDPDGPSRRGRK